VQADVSRIQRSGNAGAMGERTRDIIGSAFHARQQARLRDLARQQEELLGRKRQLQGALPAIQACFWFARVVVVGLLLSGVSHAGTLGDAAVLAAVGADIYTTHQALERGLQARLRGDSGGQELNTVASLRGQAAIHVGVAGASILLAHQAERGGHRGWARAIRTVPVVIFGGAAAWNFTRGGR
jgi:hypothetical protein